MEAKYVQFLVIVGAMAAWYIWGVGTFSWVFYPGLAIVGVVGGVFAWRRKQQIQLMLYLILVLVSILATLKTANLIHW